MPTLQADVDKQIMTLSTELLAELNQTLLEVPLLYLLLSICWYRWFSKNFGIKDFSDVLLINDFFDDDLQAGGSLVNTPVIGDTLIIHDNNNLTSIWNNSKLTDISVLNNVIAVGDLSICDNSNLTYISGLSNLRRIEGSLTILRNPNIDFQPLHNVVCIDNTDACLYCPSWLVNKPRCTTM